MREGMQAGEKLGMREGQRSADSKTKVTDKLGGSKTALK